MHTFEEYLALEDPAEFRSEFYDGKIVPMDSSTFVHALIGANISGELGNALKRRGCFVFACNMRLAIQAANCVVYPDVMVMRGQAKVDPRRIPQDDVVNNPTVVVEILSDNTAAWDWGGKFRLYELLPSLREYVLVEQKEAHIDVLRRVENGMWELERYAGLEAQVEFKSIGVSIPAREIYHLIEFE